MTAIETFEAHRPMMLALAYRMLGDLERAEDVVQDAWMRWEGRADEVDAPKAFLLKVVTRLCLNEMGSARARREESRGDRLPEPIDLHDGAIGRMEMVDQISMAFLVVLQRLTPAERATLLLHDVFDLGHAEIAALIGKTEAACRQLLSRARANVAEEKRAMATSPEEHRRLLQAFVQASSDGDQQRMIELLADDAELVVDAGPSEKRLGRIRNLGRPVFGSRKIAAFLAAVAREIDMLSSYREQELNGQAAFVRLVEGRPQAALFVSVAEGKIRRIFVQADTARLSRVAFEALA
ncbi:MAG TPA: sigma-70 family RNA polymerase sigma factor [Polyangia bacterium]|nr:sigma-70 family RNA polymerase sigma factor [Polyangia bacterium]